MITQKSETCGDGDFLIEPDARAMSFYTAFGLGTDEMFLYTIRNEENGEWEQGTGYLKDPVTLVRKTVIVSSAGPLQRLFFSQGRKNVFNAGARTDSAGAYGGYGSTA